MTYDLIIAVYFLLGLLGILIGVYLIGYSFNFLRDFLNDCEDDDHNG